MCAVAVLWVPTHAQLTVMREVTPEMSPLDTPSLYSIGGWKQRVGDHLCYTVYVVQHRTFTAVARSCSGIGSPDACTAVLLHDTAMAGAPAVPQAVPGSCAGPEGCSSTAPAAAGSNVCHSRPWLYTHTRRHVVSPLECRLVGK